MIDVVGTSASIIVIICASLASITNLRLFRQLGTNFFRYTTSSYFCMTLWMCGFLFRNIFDTIEYLNLVQQFMPFFSGMGWLCFALLFASGEHAKRSPNTRLIHLLFLVSGVGIILSFEPMLYTVQFVNSGFIVGENIAILFVRIATIPIAIYMLVPVLLGILKMFRRHPVRFRKVAAVLILLVICGGSAAALFVLAQSMAIGALVMLPAAISAGMFLWSMIWILDKHPTLFLASRHDLVELILVEKGSGLPVYVHGFDEVEPSVNPEIVSAFVTSARYALHEATQLASPIEHFYFGESEAIMNEGLFVYGIILSRNSSPLLAALLRLTIEEFEAVYWFYSSDGVRPKAFLGFDEFVRKMFEFDLPESLMG